MTLGSLAGTETMTSPVRALFRMGQFTLHSGDESFFKIDCDALGPVDWNSIAHLARDIYSLEYRSAVGVPSGGIELAKKMNFMVTTDSDVTLICDDVLTTGASMEEMRVQIGGRCQGLVLFARGECPDWIIPIFKLTLPDGKTMA